MNYQQINICIHAFFGIKDSLPMIKESIEKELYNKIFSKITTEYKSRVININGTEDHSHILFLLNPIYCPADILKNIKGETSHWINQNELTEEKFSWQKGYFAHSVSENEIDKISRYIDIQKEFHKQYSFKDDCDIFLKKYGRFGI